jgi:DNA-binding MarR family transcriptional regulator
MDTSAPTLEETVDCVLETLPHVWDRIRSNLRAAGTSRFGITLEQFHALRHIRRGYQSVTELADKKQISRPAASQAVSALVAKGLVTRRQEGEDHRCVHLELTPYAIEVLDANFAENRVWMTGKMAGLNAEERRTVRKAMECLAATFTPGEVQTRTP